MVTQSFTGFGDISLNIIKHRYKSCTNVFMDLQTFPQMNQFGKKNIMTDLHIFKSQKHIIKYGS